MYKLLLADDETATREGILKSINWQRIGIAEVRAAKNGAQALDIAKEFIPDILLTDIKMPKMDGIALSHHVKDINPDCSLLIMSGYSEVDFLKSAIRLSALNFVDKPIDVKKLTEWIIKSVDVQKKIKRNKEYIQNNRLFLINDTALGLIRNKSEAKRYILTLKELYPDLDLDCKCGCLILKLFTEDFTNNPKDVDLSETITQIGKLLSKTNQFVLGTIDSATMVVFLFASNTDNNPYPIDLCENLISICKPFELFISIGETADNLKDAYQAYITASSLLSHVFFSKEKRILKYNNQSSKTLDSKYMSQQIESFLIYLKNGDKQEAIKIIENSTFHISMHPNTETSIVIDFYFNLILEVLRQKNTYSTRTISSPDHDNILSQINSCTFLVEIKEYTKNFVNQYFNNLYINNAITPIDRVISIIHSHYDLKELTLNDISQQTFLSTPYICTKFKEITGTTFTRYLTEYRIEKALELLRDKNNKISHIAEKVGFANGNYFSKTFRKIKGISPLEYRQRFYNKNISKK